MDPPPKRQRLSYSAHRDFARSLNDQPYDHHETQNIELMEGEEEDDTELLYDDEEDEWDDDQDPVQELQQRRALLDNKLKSTFESIFDKYGKDFDGVGDEIDLYSGTIIVNNGHLMKMEDERDAEGKSAMLRAFTADSEEEIEETSSSMEESEGHDQIKYDEANEDEESEEDGEDNDGPDDEDVRIGSSEDELEEEDIILRGLQPLKKLQETQRKPSPKPFSATKTHAYHSDDVRDAAISGLQNRSATLPLETDILTQFGPRLGPEIVRYISQQRVFDDRDVEPAWRGPSVVSPTLPDNSGIDPAWRAPPIPTATSSRRPVLKSVLVQPEIERTPSPDPGLSIWAPEARSKNSRKSVVPRKARIEFTSEDEALIVEWVAKAHQQGIPIRSERLWRELELKNPRHTGQSWKKHCYRKFSHLIMDRSEDSEPPSDDPFRTSLPMAHQDPVRPTQVMVIQSPLELRSTFRTFSSHRSTSQRPSRTRRPAQRDSTLINWTDAVATVEEIDPELHAGLLEDLEELENYRPEKQESLSPSNTHNIQRAPTSGPMGHSPAVYAHSSPIHPKSSPSQETKIIPNSQSPSAEPGQTASFHAPEASSNDIATPPARMGELASPLKKPQVEIVDVNASSHTRPSPILSPLHMDGRSSSNSSPQADQGNSMQGNTSSAPIENSILSSAVPNEPLQPETPDVTDVSESQRTLHCTLSGCQRTFTKPWTLKSHIQTHERKEKLAAELAKTPKRSGFLQWDDFDELSLGPDDFILVSSKPKSRSQRDSPARAIRLKREETVFAGLPSIEHATPAQKTDFNREIDVDDYDELAGDDYSLISLPPSKQPATLQSSKKSNAKRLQSAMLGKVISTELPNPESLEVSTAAVKGIKVPISSSTASAVISRHEKSYAIEVNGTTVMRRREDSWLNATHILRLAGLRHKDFKEAIRKDVLTGEHRRIQGGRTYQGFWVNFERGVKLCQQYGVEELLRPLLSIEQEQQVYPTAKVGSKRTYEQMITPSSSVQPPPRIRTVVEDSNEESGLSSSIVGSSPGSIQVRKRNTTGISPQQAAGNMGVNSNLMVLVTPMKREARDVMMHGGLSDEDMNARASSVLKTPGGTLRRCGLDGFRCERAFCLKCESPTWV